MPESAREILTARLARLLFWLGRRPESEARAVLATTADANLAAEMRLILAYLDYSRGDAEKAVSALRTAAADPEVPERWRARHLSLQAMIERCGLDDLDAAERTANEALVRARAADDDFAVAHSLQNLWQVESVARRHELALHHVDEALSSLHGRTSYADLQLSLLDNRVFTLQNLDRLDEASHTLASAQDLVLRRGLPGGLHIPAAVHYFWLGRWDEAITELDSVMQDGPEITFYGLRQRGAILLLHGAAALIAAHRDDTSELEHHLKAAEDYPLATVADKEHCDFLVAAAALAAEQRGRSDEALDLFLPILDLKYAKMMLRHQWLPTVVRVALGIGATDVADRALGVCQAEAELELVPGRASAAHDWCRGLIGREPNTLLTVADRFAVVGRPLEHALVLEDVAVLLAERGDSERAAEAISDATLIYTDIGAAWDIRRAEARLQPYCLRRLADGGPSSDERHRRVLSVADLRVAELVVAGWPNTDIAVRLAMSRTAVQTHVARVQRKLGVHSRLGVTRRALRVHLDRWHGEPGQRTDETALAPKPLARGGH